MAWHVAAFMRKRRLPALKGVLAKMDPDELTEEDVEVARGAHGDIEGALG